MSSHKRVSFSSVLIYLLADNIPFLQDSDPFPLYKASLFLLGTVPGLSGLRVQPVQGEKTGEDDSGVFPGQMPWVPLFYHF